jgi:hypothetical protein
MYYILLFTIVVLFLFRYYWIIQNKYIIQEEYQKGYDDYGTNTWRVRNSITLPDNTKHDILKNKLEQMKQQAKNSSTVVVYYQGFLSKTQIY